MTLERWHAQRRAAGPGLGRRTPGSLGVDEQSNHCSDAPAHVLAGWEREAGQEAVGVPYWDAVAALNTPTVLHGWPGFADDGSPLDAATVTERRDGFLRTALDQLPTRVR